MSFSFEAPSLAGMKYCTFSTMSCSISSRCFKMLAVFISAMSRSKKSNQIVKSLVNLSHDLGMEVVAEGIETEHEAELMRNYKAAFGQGFHFSRPVNETEFVKLLRRPQIELAG